MEGYGNVSKGCTLCSRAEKIPVYTTFICNKKEKCIYCPVAIGLFGSDQVMVGSKRIHNSQELIKSLENAKGASITGGEPLAVPERTLDIIAKIKEVYGKDFHLHMYTNGLAFDETIATKFYKAGLDEIKLHTFDLEKFKLARKFDWDVSASLVCLPEQKEFLLAFIKQLEGLGVNSVTLSEAEVSKLNSQNLRNAPYETEGKSIKGSKQCCLDIIDYARKNNWDISINSCIIEEVMETAKQRVYAIEI